MEIISTDSLQWKYDPWSTSSVISGIYISKLVPFAHGSYEFNRIEKVDALHRETLYTHVL